MKRQEIESLLKTEILDDVIKQCICDNDMQKEKNRYLDLIKKAYDQFGDQEYSLFSAPGRTEVGGNHTDHQRGRVLAASVNMDMVAVVTPCDGVIEFVSEGFSINPISLDDLSIKEDEVNTSEGLIRGICARFIELGYLSGGFKAYCNSGVLPGSGISSSAAFEVLVGTILNHLYNEGKVSAIEIAQIGQYAENYYFKKPCGLMDQMACSVGGFVTIDFEDVKNPVVEKVDFDFANCNYVLCLIDTKGDHADLSEEYGLMPKEMKEVAQVLSKEVMSEVTMDEFIENIATIRKQTSDRSILRGYHFLNENKRVLKQVESLKENDLPRFLNLIIESGYSSYMYLQNVYSTDKPSEQNLSVALAISENLLQDDGAWRVHGGGLAGTIQAFVPKEKLADYRFKMEEIYGENSCIVLSIRPVGGVKIL